MNDVARAAYSVRELRNARGLSLDALAERSNVSRSNIALIERGGSSPTAAVLDNLATAFGSRSPPYSRKATRRRPLVLDTVTGGDAERSYERAGRQRVGTG
jgi:transcriptional regulator with XRE-family HTH domain